MNAFVPGAFTAPQRPCGRVPAVCAQRPAQSAFMGAPMVFAARPVAQPVRSGAASVRMDVTIVVGENEPIESAIRRFKKDVTRSGHLFELRRRRYFETATEKRIRKAAAAKRKARIARNMNRNNGGSSS